MATIYSLICFGGRTGKTVTLSIANPCVVTLTNHGLRDGSGVVLSTTGALPAGVTAGVTYYAKSTAANTHNLYDTAANAIAGGTTGRITTSGTQSGTHTIKGALLSGLTTAQLLRYGSAGSERIYDGLASTVAARGAVSSQYDTEIVEIGDGFTDTCAAVTLAMVRAETIFAPEIAGVKTPAWHGGVLTAGYQLKLTASFGIGIDITGYRHTIRDINIISSANSCQLVRFAGMFNSIDNCFFVGTFGQSQTGCNSQGAANNFRNNVVLYMWKGVLPLASTTVGNVIANNIVAKGETGFVGGTNVGGFYYGNLSIGNSTANWTAQTGVNDAINNFGISTDTGTATPWYKGTDTSKKTLTADNTTFVNWAGVDLRPASSSAPQVDTGVVVVGMPSFDIAGNVKSSYNNGGSVEWDGGAFEFDRGFGNKPVNVVLQNVVSGSLILITDMANVEITRGTATGGDTTLTMPAPATTQTVKIKVRKSTTAPFYQSFETQAVITSTGASIYINQLSDE